MPAGKKAGSSPAGKHSKAPVQDLSQILKQLQGGGDAAGMDAGQLNAMVQTAMPAITEALKDKRVQQALSQSMQQLRQQLQGRPNARRQ